MKKKKSIPVIEEIKINVKLRLMYHPDRKKNSLHFSFHDTFCKISENSRDIGEVKGCRGSTEIVDYKRGISYKLSPLKFFNAYQKAIEQAIAKAEGGKV